MYECVFNVWDVHKPEVNIVLFYSMNGIRKIKTTQSEGMERFLSKPDDPSAELL